MRQFRQAWDQFADDADRLRQMVEVKTRSADRAKRWGGGTDYFPRRNSSGGFNDWTLASASLPFSFLSLVDVMANLHVSDIISAEKTFAEAYGRSLIEWGIIEQRLCLWFVHLTQMPDPMARSMFYDGVNSFEPRKRLIKISARHSGIISPGIRDFLITAVNKADKYSVTRNQLAHCETKLDFDESSPTYKEIILVEGGQPIVAMDTALTLSHLPIIIGNYRELSRLIMDAYTACGREPESTFRTLREQVHALPPAAHDTKPNLTTIKD
jgi:hypothetical protein